MDLTDNLLRYDTIITGNYIEFIFNKVTATIAWNKDSIGIGIDVDN
jgi:hypothetical protein